MPWPRLSPERGHTLCASLRSRNALQHVTSATSYGNLQVKCRRPEWAPRSGTGLYTYRKNPWVWTNCLGNQKADCNCLVHWHGSLKWCKRVTSGLYKVCVALRQQEPPRCYPGHTGTRAQPRSTGTTPIHGPVGTRAPGHRPTEDCPPDLDWYVNILPQPRLHSHRRLGMSCYLHLLGSAKCNQMSQCKYLSGLLDRLP